MSLDMVMLLALVVAALWTVMSRSLLRAALGLALTSVILAIIMYRFVSPLAAVFELSVCAGLISVLFISIISLTRSMTMEEVLQHMKDRLHRFWFLPVLLIIGGIVLSFIRVTDIIKLPEPETVTDVRAVMWNLRSIDILGQIIVLLVGAFGVVILFKEKVKK